MIKNFLKVKNCNKSIFSLKNKKYIFLKSKKQKALKNRQNFTKNEKLKKIEKA